MSSFSFSSCDVATRCTLAIMKMNDASRSTDSSTEANELKSTVLFMVSNVSALTAETI